MSRTYLTERAGRIKGRREWRKNARVARTRRQVLRFVFLLVLVILGIGGFSQIQWGVMDPSVDVKVFGNTYVTNAQVRHELLPFMRKPIYTLDPKILESQVELLPEVQKAFVRRYLFPRPHLVVNIMEEFPWASCAGGPASSVDRVVSQTGRFIPLSQFPSLPKPELLFFVSENTKFNENTVGQWSNWVNYMQAQSQKNVRYIDLRKTNDIRVVLGDNYELQLKLGVADSSLSKRLSRLPSILPLLAGLKENIEHIDLSLDSNVPLLVSKLPKKEIREQNLH